MKIFNTIFNRLNDNTERATNPALNRNDFGGQPETNDWDARTANLYQVYSYNRVHEGMTHENACADAEKKIS